MARVKHLAFGPGRYRPACGSSGSVALDPSNVNCAACLDVMSARLRASTGAETKSALVPGIIINPRIINEATIAALLPVAYRQAAFALESLAAMVDHEGEKHAAPVAAALRFAATCLGGDADHVGEERGKLDSNHAYAASQDSTYGRLTRAPFTGESH